MLVQIPQYPQKLVEQKKVKEKKRQIRKRKKENSISHVSGVV